MTTSCLPITDIGIKLLALTPQTAKHVLEFSFEATALHRVFRTLSPQVKWSKVSFNPLEKPDEALDAFYAIEEEHLAAVSFKEAYDVILIADVLERVKSPETFLQQLFQIANPETKILLLVPNMGHASVIAQLLSGDVSQGATALLAPWHPKLISYASCYKLLLDAGFLPHLEYVESVLPQADFLKAQIQAAALLGIPTETAERNLTQYQQIISCRKFVPPSYAPMPSQKLAVVVPVSRPLQYELNISNSPGLAEINAQIIPIENAKNPQEALQLGRLQTNADWVLFCHQDVYVPKGTGHLLLRLLNDVPKTQRQTTLIGFAGMVTEADGQEKYAGLVIDRQHLFDHPNAGTVFSFDEFGLVFAKESIYNIDPALGWHLWATDLCLQAQQHQWQAHLHIARVPIFHNTYGSHSLPEDFYRSLERLHAKYPSAPRIRTLWAVHQRRK